MKPMEYLEELSQMTPEEFDRYRNAMGFTKLNISSELLRDIELSNEIYHEYMGAELNAIFGSPGTSGGSGNTTNNNTWRTIPIYIPAAPSVTQTLYRRNTHDENGDAKQFTKEQEQMWRDLSAVATMTSPYIWKTAEEIHRDAEDYQKRTRAGGMYISKDSVETSLATLVMNGMVEEKNV